VVAASDRALREKRDVIRSFLKVIAAGSDIILNDKEKALAAEARWTRSAPEIGWRSISQVTYVSRAGEAWLAAVDVWLDMLASSQAFQKNLKDKSPMAIRSIAFDLAPLNEALAEMRGKGR
jgi:hypothetical protein